MTEEENLVRFLNSHQNEMIDWINSNIRTQFAPSGNIFDRLANQVNQEYPYGKNIDNAHRFLANAIMCSLWCGWFSCARTTTGDANFKPEYIERFRNIINESFDIGQRFATLRP